MASGAKTASNELCEEHCIHCQPTVFLRHQDELLKNVLSDFHLAQVYTEIFF